MKQVRIADRRTDCDRRNGELATYRGPERRSQTCRRSGFDRRNGQTAFCIYCGEVCSPATMEISIGRRTGICIECCSKRFSQFYGATERPHLER